MRLCPAGSRISSHLVTRLVSRLPHMKWSDIQRGCIYFSFHLEICIYEDTFIRLDWLRSLASVLSLAINDSPRISISHSRQFVFASTINHEPISQVKSSNQIGLLRSIVYHKISSSLCCPLIQTICGRKKGTFSASSHRYSKRIPHPQRISFQVSAFLDVSKSHTLHHRCPVTNQFSWKLFIYLQPWHPCIPDASDCRWFTRVCVNQLSNISNATPLRPPSSRAARTETNID